MAYPIVIFLFPVPVSSWSLCKPNSVQTIRILRHVTKTVVAILLGLLMMPRGIKKHALAAVQICGGNIGQRLGWFLYSCWEEINWCVMWKSMRFCSVSFIYCIYIYINLYDICFFQIFVWFQQKILYIKAVDDKKGRLRDLWTMKCKQFDNKRISQSCSKLLVIHPNNGKNVKNTCFIVVF